MRTSKQCFGLFMSTRFILSAIWQTSPKDRGWSSLLHQRGKNNMSAVQLEKELIRDRFFVQIYPATLAFAVIWINAHWPDISFIWNLKLILPNMTSKQIHEWPSLKSWKARKYHPQNLPSSPDPVFWVIPQQFRRWGVYDLWQTTILLDFPSFGSKSWSDEVILRLSSGTYNLHR